MTVYSPLGKKLTPLDTFFVPHLDFILRGEIETTVNVPSATCTEDVFIPSPLGGVGILPFSELRNF